MVFQVGGKKGVIRTLLKREDNDPGSVKSYRPVCFIPVLGKVDGMKWLMVEEMRNIFYGGISERQFGYMTSRSTEDAIEEVGRIVKTRREKYCYGIFLDMSGAFDRVGWPEVVSK